MDANAGWLMLNDLIVVVRLFLAVIFLEAGILKLVDFAGWKRSAGNLLPAPLVVGLAWLLPFAEMALALLLAFHALALVGAIGMLAFLLVAIAVVGWKVARGEAYGCRCFGALSTDAMSSLLRDDLLAVLAGFVIWQCWLAKIIGFPETDIGPDFIAWLSGLSIGQSIGLLIGLVIANVLLLKGTSLSLRKKPLEKLQAGEIAPKFKSSMPGGPAGLPIGTPAPPFDCLNEHGERQSLHSLAAQGKPLLLLFTSPLCQTCHPLLTEIEQRERTLVLLRRQENEPGQQDERYVRALLNNEITRAYRIVGIPAAVIVNADGTIGSRVALGAAAIRALAAG